MINLIYDLDRRIFEESQKTGAPVRATVRANAATVKRLFGPYRSRDTERKMVLADTVETRYGKYDVVCREEIPDGQYLLSIHEQSAEQS